MVTRLGIINWKTCARKRPWPSMRHPFWGSEGKKSVAGTSQKQSGTPAYTVAIIERIYLWKPILNMQHHIFMWLPLQLSSVGRRGSAGMTRLRDRQPRNHESIPCNDRVFISYPRRPERLWCSPSLLFNGFQAFQAGVRGPGRVAHESPSSIPKDKNELLPLPLPVPAWRGQWHFCFRSLSEKVYFHTLQVAV
jgi:hypothetical protein